MAWCKFGVDDVESEMTQPAKVQEPSMEEILASIRRIIADDEAKPSDNKAAAAPAAAPPPKPAMKDIPPSAIASAPPAKAAAPAPAPKPAPPPAPPPAASNSQNDIDAMLASLEEMTPEEDVRPPQLDGEVFELTDDMALADPQSAQPAAAAFHKVDPQDDLEFTEAIAAARAAPRAPAAEAPPMEMAVQATILSRTTVNAVESAFNTLANTVLSNNARTLEDLVKEMLRPMLKSWLDDNLPGLVERIVKAEIERVSRGR
jgi:cell pole-organizing protein PopZ